MEDVEMECTITDTELSVSWWCHGCGESLTMVTDPTSGVVDWGAEGDFGCNANGDEDSVSGHLPTLDTPSVRTYWRDHHG